jgi:cysteine-rich repeat protein
MVSMEVVKEEDGYVNDNTDCDDENANINPDAMEIEDNEVDENCDGFKNSTWYQDSDGDGYGNSAVSQVAPVQPTGYVLDNTDCNDQNSAVNPGATEVSGDGGLDNNCDGMIEVVCGDGNVEGSEACDDGNTAAGDGCDPTCLVEVGWDCETNDIGVSICSVLD